MKGEIKQRSSYIHICMFIWICMYFLLTVHLYYEPNPDSKSTIKKLLSREIDTKEKNIDLTY